MTRILSHRDVPFLRFCIQRTGTAIEIPRCPARSNSPSTCMTLRTCASLCEGDTHYDQLAMFTLWYWLTYAALRISPQRFCACACACACTLHGAGAGRGSHSCASQNDALHVVRRFELAIVVSAAIKSNNTQKQQSVQERRENDAHHLRVAAERELRRRQGVAGLQQGPLPIHRRSPCNGRRRYQLCGINANAPSRRAQLTYPSAYPWIRSLPLTLS